VSTKSVIIAGSAWRTVNVILTIGFDQRKILNS